MTETPSRKTVFPWLGLAFVLCSLYWSYCLLTTEMLILHDAIGYENLGRLLVQEPWREYFTTGPNREPLYPLLVSLAMHLEKNFSLSYQIAQKIIQIFFIVITQFLVWRILTALNIKKFLKVLCVLYLGFSPGLINSSLSLFSEIMTYPFILATVLVMAKSWKIIFQNKASGRQNLLWASLTALLFLCLTLLKGLFELITPLLLALMGMVVLVNRKEKNISAKAAVFLLMFSIIFYLPLVSYKCLNKKYNSHFVLTGRGASAFYGNTVRATQPLNPARVRAALLYIPDASGGLCWDILNDPVCDFWSYLSSDELSTQKVRELHAQGLFADDHNRALFSFAVQEIVQNPFQYFALRMVEGLKMFFWESTTIGYVVYPDWMLTIFHSKTFSRILGWTIGIVSLLAFFYSGKYIWARRREIFSPTPLRDEPALLLFSIFIFLVAYIASHSFFLILPRYALPIAPLFLILIAFSLQKIFTARSPVHSRRR